MNVGEMYALRKRMDSLCELCDSIEGVGLWPGSGTIRLRDAFRLDLANFCMYLSASDGKIAGGEVLFFKVALGFDVSVDELIKRIREQGLYSGNFENSVPMTLKFLKGIEDKLLENGMSQIAGQTDLFVDFYYDLGCGLIRADGDLNDNELRDLNIYMNTVYNYVGTVNRKLAKRASEGCNSSGNENSHTGTFLSELDFESVRLNGFGNKVATDIELPSRAMIVTAKHTMGNSNFIVRYYDSEGNKSESFVNEIGEYAGTFLFNNSGASRGTGIIEVEADGKWSLEFIAIPKAVGLDGSSNIKGRGCTISDAFWGNGKPNVVKFKHDGSSNFCVRVVSDDGDNNLLVNEIGFYSGEKVMKLQNGMRYFVLVKADGNWSVDFGMGDTQKICKLKEQC
jgi:hypothetical protein